MQELHCPLPPGSEAVHCRSSTAHCPQAVRQCIAGVALPTAPRQCGSALRELRRPLPPGSEAVHCRSSTPHCPRAVRQCIAGVALSTAPRQCGSALRELRRPLPQAGRQCIAGDARPTAPREGGSERREYHSPLPSGNAAVRSTISIAHSPQAAWQCVTLPTAPCPQQQCSKAHTVQCGAEHQAVRHHTEGTGGAARHAGCSGQIRPCVTARRRRQGSVGQVRECTGPAMPQHTYTQRAHNTHSPARLPVPVGRHPDLCLLVTAPSAQYTTAQHNTAQHNTTQLNTTTQHSTAQHSTAQHNTTQHYATNAAQHKRTQDTVAAGASCHQCWPICVLPALCHVKLLHHAVR